MKLPILAICFALSLSGFLSASNGTLLVVSNTAGPGVDYTSLPVAVDAATSESTILLRPGTYALPQIQAKSVTIVGDTPGVVVVGELLVRDLSVDQVVCIRGLSCFFGSAFKVENCLGEVWFEDCSFDGGYDHSLDLLLARSVTLVDSVFLSGFEGIGGLLLSAVDTSSSNVQFYGSEVFADTSTFGSFCQTTPGLRISGGRLYAQNSTFHGADCCCHPSGAVPIYKSPNSGSLWFQSCTFVPGTGTNGYVSPEVTAGGGGEATADVTRWTGVSRVLQLESLLRAGSTYQATFGGAPNELALVFVSEAPTARLLPAYESLVSIVGPAIFVAAVQLDGAGAGSLDVTPTLSPGLETTTTYVQAIHVGTEIRAGSPTAVTVIPATL